MLRTFRGVEKLFDGEWHKLALSVKGAQVKLLVDCEEVSTEPLDEPRPVILRGYTSIVKRTADDRSVSVSNTLECYYSLAISLDVISIEKNCLFKSLFKKMNKQIMYGILKIYFIQILTRDYYIDKNFKLSSTTPECLNLDVYESGIIVTDNFSTSLESIPKTSHEYSET